MPMPIMPLLAAAIVASAASSTATPAHAAIRTATGQDTTAKAVTPAKPARKNRDVITPDEFDRPEIRTLSLLDAIKRVRPSFLNKRGASSFGSMADPNAGQPHVSIDWQPLSGLDDLAAMTLDAVKEVRYLDAAKATQRFGGAAMSAPVIVVITR
jgi:hypothetical protein